MDEFYAFAEMQSVYSAASANSANLFRVSYPSAAYSKSCSKENHAKKKKKKKKKRFLPQQINF